MSLLFIVTNQYATLFPSSPCNLTPQRVDLRQIHGGTWCLRLVCLLSRGIIWRDNKYSTHAVFFFHLSFIFRAKGRRFFFLLTRRCESLGWWIYLSIIRVNECWCWLAWQRAITDFEEGALYGLYGDKLFVTNMTLPIQFVQGMKSSRVAAWPDC